MKRLAVFGNPVKHSLSPIIHQLFAQQYGIKLTYQAIEAPLEDFEAEVHKFFANGGSGANITIPFKQLAYAMVQADSPFELNLSPNIPRRISKKLSPPPSSQPKFTYHEEEQFMRLLDTQKEKEQAQQLITEAAHLHAKQSCAANTLYLAQGQEIQTDTEDSEGYKKEKIQLIAANTDGIGLVQDMQNNKNWQLKDKSALILGAGGAVRNIIPALFEAGLNDIVISNRTHSRAEELAEHFTNMPLNMSIKAVSWTQLEDLCRGISEGENRGMNSPAKYDIIINGTSMGMGAGKSIEQNSEGFGTQITDAIIHKDAYCYDLVYSKDSQQQTAFIRWAQALGAKEATDGLGMLVEQAAVSFKIWNGIKKPLNTSKVIAKIRTVSDR